MVGNKFKVARMGATEIKKFTVISLPEYEALVLEAIGNTGVAQLKEASGGVFEKLKEIGGRIFDFKALYEKFNETYEHLVEVLIFEPEWEELSKPELRKFTEDPEGTVDLYITKINECIEKLTRERELRARRETMRARGLFLPRTMARARDEQKRCLGAGVVDLNLVQWLVESFQKFEDVNHKVIEITPERGYVFVVGLENRREWVETLFAIFEVKDIHDMLVTREIILKLDAEINEEAFKECREGIEKLGLMIERGEELDLVKDQIEGILKDQFPSFCRKSKFLDHILEILSKEGAPVLRTRVISVIQGWVHEDKLKIVDEAIRNVEERVGESFITQYQDPTPDELVPTPRTTIKPSFLDPAFSLMTLRGWPTAFEVNPALLTIIIFSLQFGIMFGDVGQGLIFLLLGLLLSRKFKRGMMAKIAVAWVPMGIFSIIFGFLYGEVFLIEGIIPPILVSPIHQIGKLFKFVLGIAVMEMSLGLVIGAINAVKEGHTWGPIGQHGAGSILFLVGLYFGALHLLEVRDFMSIMSHWSFMMMITGLMLSGIEPLITAFMHGEPGAEVLGELVGAFMMVFVESLANFFSFLRIGAFALAHACLAIATTSLTAALGPLGIVLMNMIAMTFEFVSSSVQSLRLLYYEFMSKFFKGTGTELRPFRLRERSK